MAKYYLQSVTKPELKFEILGRNKETGVMKLRGEFSDFDAHMDKAKMALYKYRIATEEEIENAN